MTTLNHAIAATKPQPIQRAQKQQFTAQQRKALRIADRVAKKNAELLRRLA